MNPFGTKKSSRLSRRHQKTGRGRRGLALIMAAVIATAGLVAGAPPASAETARLFVEGENAVSTNFAPGVTSLAEAHGGKYLNLNTATVAPEGGYVATYEVTAAKAGPYSLEIGSTPVSLVWASTYTVTVNGGEPRGVTTAVELRQISDTMRAYDVGTVTLQEGVNTVTITVKDRRRHPDTNYVTHLDYLQFTEIEVDGLFVEGENAVSTNFAPGVTSLAEAHGGKYLNLNTATVAPEGGYVATYEVTAAKAGPYSLEIGSTPLNVVWASKYTVTVNDGEPRDVTPAVELRQISDTMRAYDVGDFALQEGANTVTITTKNRRVHPDKNYVTHIDYLQFTLTDVAALAIDSEAPLNVFENGDEVDFDVVLNGAVPTDSEATWQIRDYWDEPVDDGEVTIAEGQDRFAVNAGTLANGAYSVAVQIGDRRFTSSVVVAPARAQRPDIDDSPFALDSAASQLVDPRLYDEYAEALAIVGASWIRDRSFWNDAVNPSPGVFDFTADPNPRLLAEAMRDADGPQILGMYASTPKRLVQAGDVMPSDLKQAYLYAREQAAHYGDLVGAWEIWNEADGVFSSQNEAADRYAALLKAMAIGYADSGANPLVSVEGSAYSPPVAWVNLMLSNGILDFVDIYNFHLHVRHDPSAAITEFPYAGVKAHMDQLEQFGGADVPAWLTEAGIAIPTVAGEGMTREQKIAQARYIPTSAILSIAQGVDKHFGFIATPFAEPPSWWGMFDEEFAPQASFAAEAAMTFALGAGEYLGRAQGVPAGVEAHVFDTGSKTALAVWSEAPTQVTVDFDAAEVTRIDIMGQSSTPATSAGQLVIDAGPDIQYFQTDGELAVTPAARSLTEMRDRDPFAVEDRVVLRQEFAAEARTGSKANGYSLSIPGEHEVRVEVMNLNDAPITAEVELRQDKAWTIAEESVTVEVPAWSSVDTVFHVSAGGEVSANELATFVAQATVGGKQTSVASSWVRAVTSELSFSQGLDESGEQLVLEAKYTNTGAEARTLDTVAIIRGSATEETDVDRVVAPGETVRITVPHPAPDASSVGFTGELRFADGSKLRRAERLQVTPVDDMVAIARADVSIDTELADMPELSRISLPEDGTVRLVTIADDDDLSAEVAFAWDDEHLWMRAEVTDDVHDQVNGPAAFLRGDSIQLGISPASAGETAQRVEYTLGLADEGPKLYRGVGLDGSAAGLRNHPVSIERDETAKTTSYAVAIPWAELSLSGDVRQPFGLSLVLNEKDNTTEKGFVEWGSGLGLTKSTTLYKTIRLIEPATVTSQPRASNVLVGESAVFSVAATGFPAPDIRWQRAQDADWVDVEGASGAELSWTTDAADDGARVRAVVDNGFTRSYSTPATVNVEDPFAAALKITTPSGSEPAKVTVPKPEIAGEVEAGSSVRVVIKDEDNNEVAAGDAEVTDHTWTFTPDIDLSNGDYTIEVTATKGGQTATKTKDIMVDTTAPDLKITAPAGDTVNVSQPVIAGTTDPEATISIVIKDKGGNIVERAPIVIVDEHGNWSYETDELQDGDYTIEVTSTRGDGSTTVTKNLKVDTSATPETPEVTVTSPSGTTVTTSKPVFAGTATPGATVTVVIKNENGDEITLTTTVDENGSWSVIPKEAIPDGLYNVEITAEKDQKQSTISKPLTVDTKDQSALTDLQLNSWNGSPIGLTQVSGKPNEYTASVTNSVYAVTLLPTALDPNAKIEVSVNNAVYQEVPNGEISGNLLLREGVNTIVVKVTDSKGNVAEYKLTVTRASSGSGNNGGNNSGTGGGGTPTPTPKPEDTGIQTSVNGKDGTFATGTTSNSGGRTTTSVQVDLDKLNETLSQGSGQKLEIRSPKDGDMKVDGLTAGTVKQLADKGASLEISNPLAIYPVPGGKMDLSGVSKQLGNAALGDIAVHIDIKRSSDELINKAKSKAAAEGYELLVTSVDLDLTFSHDGKTVRSGQLNGYAAKYIALPEGIDPNRITTGVIVNPDGSVYHVPTVVTKINNRYYAMINDLRSSGTYSVIWNPQDFDDVKKHWGKADVNNIAARLDLAGTGNNTFSPDRNVTRSEFSEIVVLGLGLMRQNAPQNQFPDIPASAWYRNAVAIANEFDIVRGYSDGNFYGNLQITREQGFAMIARAYNLVVGQKTALSQDRISALLVKYEDAASVSGWARADVALLIEAGIVQGNGPKLLSPQSNMTRAEVTALIARMLKTTDLIDF
ncbi:S-layer homology domain-containing protein [Paenibacillaceae bacterium WGS1546]|uniref:S-layer homology domain-containing protein n=1 Tax=Cohnella sp. WGS1546 TaxID=3366810 RepID=UPI00372D30D7